jgi:soluble lytic murein transglycosylase-like protein
MPSPLLRPLRIAALFACLAVPSVALADIYVVRDKDGNETFVNRKPAAGSFKVVVKANDRGASNGARIKAGVTPVPPSDRDVNRYTRYDEWIRQASGLYQIPEQLVRAIIRCESDYDPRAVSVSGARGLMQLMPDTAALMQVRDIDDPRENIFGGTRLLRVLANEFNGDLELTIAAYNAGDGAVMRFGGIPPFTQTRDYVVNVTKFYRRYRAIPDTVEASLARD